MKSLTIELEAFFATKYAERSVCRVHATKENLWDIKLGLFEYRIVTAHQHKNSLYFYI